MTTQISLIISGILYLIIGNLLIGIFLVIINLICLIINFDNLKYLDD
jgi:hypothetical protein